MKLSFATLGCPNWNIEEIVRNAKAMGFDGVELRGAAGEHIGPDEPIQERRRMRALFRSAGLDIAAIMGYSNFTIDDPAKREQSIEVAIKFIDVARDIGCPVLRVFGGVLSEQLDWKGNLERVASGLKRVVPHAERKAVKIALETHDAWQKGEQLRAVIDAVGSPALGACWDVGNSFFAEPLEKTCAAIAGRIYHVHFKDAARGGEGVKSKLPGTGEVDLEKALRLLQQAGYGGYLSFEWEKKWEPSLDEPEVAFPHYVRFCEQLMEKVGVPRG